MGAIEPIIVKIAYQNNLEMFDLLVIRFLTSAIIILPFFTKFKKLSLIELKKLAPVCLLFSGINILLYISLQYLSAITVITFVTTTPAFVALLNQRRGKDILGKYFWPSFGAILIGVLLTINIQNQGLKIVSSLGLVTIILAIIGSTMYRTKMDEITNHFGAMQTSMYIFSSNGILAIFFLPFVSFSDIKTTLFFGAWTGFAAVLANISFLWAIKILGSTKISILGTLQRPIVIILSAIILKEMILSSQVVGIILVLIGIHFAKVEKRVKNAARN